MSNDRMVSFLSAGLLEVTQQFIVHMIPIGLHCISDHYLQSLNWWFDVDLYHWLANHFCGTRLPPDSLRFDPTVLARGFDDRNAKLGLQSSPIQVNNRN